MRREASVASAALAYRRMAEEVRYRPAAPSDGFGNITVDLAELDLDEEARTYARDFLDAENTSTFFIGCSNFDTQHAMIFALEACRLLCGPDDGFKRAATLLEMAKRAIEAKQDGR